MYEREGGREEREGNIGEERVRTLEVRTKRVRKERVRRDKA